MRSFCAPALSDTNDAQVQGTPNGESWEVYTVSGDSPTFYGEQDGPACCVGNAQESGGPVAASAAPCC